MFKSGRLSPKLNYGKLSKLLLPVEFLIPWLEGLIPHHQLPILISYEYERSLDVQDHLNIS